MTILSKCKKKNHKIKKPKKIYKKQYIPKALREQCWIHNFGHKFKHKCYIK